jgi:hypothetical protein
VADLKQFYHVYELPDNSVLAFAWVSHPMLWILMREREALKEDRCKSIHHKERKRERKKNRWPELGF